jgi:hypothetical protein
MNVLLWRLLPIILGAAVAFACGKLGLVWAASTAVGILTWAAASVGAEKFVQPRRQSSAPERR